MSEQEEHGPHLPGWSLDRLETTDDVICSVDRDLVITWTNAAWQRFADDNGGQPNVFENWSAEVCYADAIPAPLRGHFEGLCAQSQASEAPASFTYECSSPDTFRRFRQTVYPVRDSGAVIVNALVFERPHDAVALPTPTEDDSHRDEHGFVRQCMECRRVRRGPEDAWDWIPDWVAEPRPRTSHVLCQACYDHYHAAGDDADAA